MAITSYSDFSDSNHQQTPLRPNQGDPRNFDLEGDCPIFQANSDLLWNLEAHLRMERSSCYLAVKNRVFYLAGIALCSTPVLTITVYHYNSAVDSLSLSDSHIFGDIAHVDKRCLKKQRRREIRGIIRRDFWKIGGAWHISETESFYLHSSHEFWVHSLGSPKQFPFWYAEELKRVISPQSCHWKDQSGFDPILNSIIRWVGERRGKMHARKTFHWKSR